MNENPPQNRIIGISIIAIVGAFLIMAALVWAMQRYTRPPALSEDRVAARHKALAEIRAANIEALDNYGWQNQAKGFVRVPITNAMEITIQEWKNPAAARSNLVARANEAATPPPKPPEKPSPFE